jgi:hypothetical protein
MGIFRLLIGCGCLFDCLGPDNPKMKMLTTVHLAGRTTRPPKLLLGYSNPLFLSATIHLARKRHIQDGGNRPFSDRSQFAV